MDFHVTCLNPLVLATSFVAFIQFKYVGGRSPAILNSKKVFVRVYAILGRM